MFLMTEAPKKKEPAADEPAADEPVEGEDPTADKGEDPPTEDDPKDDPAADKGEDPPTEGEDPPTEGEDPPTEDPQTPAEPEVPGSEPEEREPQETEKKYILFGDFKELHSKSVSLIDSFSQAIPNVSEPAIKEALMGLLEDLGDVRKKLELVVEGDFTKKDYRKALTTYSYLSATVIAVTKVSDRLFMAARGKADKK
jgi:hypothetical protein